MALQAPAQPPLKKSSFLRRISLSSQPQPTAHVADSKLTNALPPNGPKKVNVRSVSGPGRKEVQAGPAYEFIPAGAAPSAFRDRAQDQSTEEGSTDKSRDRRRVDNSTSFHRPPNPSSPVVPSSIPNSVSTPRSVVMPASTSSASLRSPSAEPPGQRQRHPIHPALASPSSSPKHHEEGSSYMQSHTASPPEMTNSKPVALRPGTKAGSRPTADARSPSQISPLSQSSPGRRFLGPSSITLPPKNTYQVIASSPTSTPRASLFPPFQSAASPPGTRVFNPPPPFSDSKPISLSHSVPQATPSGLMVLSRFEEDAKGSSDRATNEVIGYIGSVKPSRPSNASLVKIRRLSSSTPDAKAAAAVPPSSSAPQHTVAAVATPRPRTQSTSVTPTLGHKQPAADARHTSSYFPPNHHLPAGLTEASAYAKSVASALAMGHPQTSARETATLASSLTKQERKVSRPLPQPPTADQNPDAGHSASRTLGNPFPVIAPNTDGRASSSVNVTMQQAQSPLEYRHPSKGWPTATILPEQPGPSAAGPNNGDVQLSHSSGPVKRLSSPSVAVDHRNSSMLPVPPKHPKSQPQSRSNAKSPIEEWAKDVAAPKRSQSPSKTRPPVNDSSPTAAINSAPHAISSSSTFDRRGAPSLTSPTFPTSGQLACSPAQVSSPQITAMINQRSPSMTALKMTSHTETLRKRGKPSLYLLLAQQQIQSSLLAFLSINSFLSLTGASNLVRKLFTGENIGRWVLREWGIQLDRERGRSWPNLTVWEGFLESLLHDPSSYSTYPTQWHSLLQHLSISHTLIVLYLRNLPASSFPNSAPLPFEDEGGTSFAPLTLSASMASLSSSNITRSRMSSTAGSDAGSIASISKMPRHERLAEIIMPEPLAAQAKEDSWLSAAQPSNANEKDPRRGSISSMVSASSLTFGRRRSNSTTTGSSIRADMATNMTGPAATWAAPMLAGKATLPPVSYPNAKRYGFTRHGIPTNASARSRNSSDSGRPRSIFSVQSSPSVSAHQPLAGSYGGRLSLNVDRQAPPVPGMPGGVLIPSPIVGHQRSSFASGSDAGRYSRKSDYGGSSPGAGRWSSPYQSKRDLLPLKAEPAFERPPPLMPGRAPILRVFVPLGDRLSRWPSAEGAQLAIRELDKCGATKRLKLGDLVVNTAIHQPRTTEHVLVFVPYVRHLLVPLEYRHCSTGHLPAYVDAFAFAPSYYYPFLPSPQIIHLNLAPFAQQALRSIRLAHDRRDMTVTSGARVSAKRYLHVAGFEIKPGDHVAPEWHGMVSLESEGTAEGKMEIERRLGLGDPLKAIMGPWEVVRERSMTGTVWLRLIRES